MPSLLKTRALAALKTGSGLDKTEGFLVFFCCKFSFWYWFFGWFLVGLSFFVPCFDFCNGFDSGFLVGFLYVSGP